MSVHVHTSWNFELEQIAVRWPNIYGYSLENTLVQSLYYILYGALQCQVNNNNFEKK